MSLKIPPRHLPVPKVWIPTVSALSVFVGTVIESGRVDRHQLALLSVAAIWAVVGYAAPK